VILGHKWDAKFDIRKPKALKSKINTNNYDLGKRN